MTNIKKLLAVNPDTLRSEQYCALKEHGLNVLKNVIKLLENDEINEIDKLLSYSPAGDDMGTSVHYINFDFSSDEYSDNDIGDFLRKLDSLKE